jgi:hypothetical protein
MKPFDNLLVPYFTASPRLNFPQMARAVNIQYGTSLSSDAVRNRYRRWKKTQGLWEVEGLNPPVRTDVYPPDHIDFQGLPNMRPGSSLPVDNLPLTEDELEALRSRVYDLELRRSSDEQERTVTNLRAMLSASERKVKEAQKQSTVTEVVREAVLEVAQSFPKPPPSYVRHNVRKPSPQEAVLMLCCLHMGEVVSAAETNGFGEYNMAIAQARFQQVIDSVIRIAHDHHAGVHIRKLWIVNLGDNISGDIHEELTTTNERPVITQTLSAAYLLALGIRDLCANFDEVEMVGLPGNHGRNRRKPMHKLKTEDSFDRMTYETAGLLCANIPNFTLTIPQAYWTRLVINDVPFVFLHGDNLKSWMGLPFYGMYRMNANMTTLHATKDEYFTYLGLGHFHQSGMLPRSGGEILLTGSLKGPDEYSLDVLQQGAEPTQLFFGVHHERGVSFRYPINAREATPEAQDRYQFQLAEVTLADMARRVGLL